MPNQPNERTHNTSSSSSNGPGELAGGDHSAPRYQAITDLHAHAGQVESVEKMLEKVREADSVEAFGEAFQRGLSEDQGHRHVLATVDGHSGGDATVIGALALTRDNVAEVAVDPDCRGRGVAGNLFRVAHTELGVQGPVDVWAHGDLAESQGFVQSLDARRTRELLKMAVDCAPGSAQRDRILAEADAAQEKVSGQGLRVDNYEELSAELGAEAIDEEWVRVNNEAFAWHPEQGGWDVSRLKNARDTAWFDPRGVLMLWDEQEQRCMGFHWTKFPEEEKDKPAGERAGEVYVVCLADEARGRGLGRVITLLGMQYLVESGAGVIELYVEGDNAPAVATYRKLGFDVVHTDVTYRGKL